MTNFEILILCFVVISTATSLTSIIFLIVDGIMERRDTKHPQAKPQKAETVHKKGGFGTREGVLIGVGVLSLLGNLLIARSINKKSDNSEERRKWKW